MIRDINQIRPTQPQRITQPTGMRKVTHQMTIGDGDSEVFCTKFDQDNQYLAAGYGDGMTRIYNAETGKLQFTLHSYTANDILPITCLLWRPQSAALKTANVLVTCGADGYIKHWHATSGRCLHSRQDNKDNDLYCMDFNPDGTLLAVAGKDQHVYVYDETTKSLAFKMKEHGEKTGHSNRIFCTKFNPVDQNMVASSGWDSTVQVYDIRYRGVVHNFWGPHICGDSMVFRNDGREMVTGSYRQDDCIEVWDMRMFKRMRVIPWEGQGAPQEMFVDNLNLDDFNPDSDFTDLDEEAKSSRPGSQMRPFKGENSSDTTANTKQPDAKKQKLQSVVAPYIYSTCFNQKQDLLFCAGAGKNEMRIFDWQSGSIVAMIQNIPKSILCGDVSKTSQFAFGSADSKIRFFNITNRV